MNLLELFTWWTITFIPFMPIPRDAECLNPQCEAIRFTIREGGDRIRLAWNEETVLAEVQDSIKYCKSTTKEL
jgi:hypothetical protein